MSRVTCRVGCLVFLVACLLGPPVSLRARSLGSDLASVNAHEAVEEGEGRKHEALFRWINFFLLAGGLVFLLRKPVADFFAQRSAAVRKSLEEGRKALENSRAQIRAVEERLRHLEEEIAAFKASAKRELEAERERLRRATEEDSEKVLESAQAQLDAAVRAARLELKAFATQQALELAEQMLREHLDEATRARLIGDFVAKVQAKANQN